MPLSEVPDSVFSEKVLGDGVAIIPADGKIVSPVDGEISTVAENQSCIWIYIRGRAGSTGSCRTGDSVIKRRML